MKKLILTFAYSLLLLCLAFQTAHAEDITGGPITKCIGAAPPPASFTFNNKTKVDIYDFTFVVRGKNGAPITFDIDTVTIDGKDFIETHNTGSFVRIQADTMNNGEYKESERLKKNKDFTVRITLTAHPTVPYEIVMQPTERTNRAVAAVAFNQPFGPCNTYVCSFPQEAVLANTYQGITIADVNTTGVWVDMIQINPGGFGIVDMEQIDPLGLPIPGGFYSPTGGVFQLPMPVPPGDTIVFGLTVDSFLPNIPMQMDLCLFPPPFEEPYYQLAGVQQLQLDPDPTAGLSGTGEITFHAFNPLIHHIQYLNIYYRPVALGDTNIYWIGQNIALELFEDTTEFSYWFPLDPLGLNIPGTSVGNVEIGWTISDTIKCCGPGSEPFIPWGPYWPPPRSIDFGPNISSPSPGFVLPPGFGDPTLPPRVWDDSANNSRGVLVGCNMPNIDLDSSRYRGGAATGPHVPNDYAGDWNACGPAATANSFSWLRGQHPDVDSILRANFGEGDSAHRKILAEFSEMMDRFDEDEVGIKDFIEGKLAFIDKYKLPIRVEFQSTFLVGAGDSVVNSPNACYGHKARNKSATPTPGKHDRVTEEFLFDAMKNGADTELNIQWMKIDSATGAITYPNGHYVVVTGVRENNGNWRIKWKDDAEQGNAGGTRQGTSSLERDTTFGIIRVPGLDNDAWGNAFIEEIVTEVYDSTVTFNSVKGTAFEDSDGDGTRSGGEGGASGGSISLTDLNNGTTTIVPIDPFGGFLLPDLLPGTFMLQVQPLPGYTFSPQNVGNDSTDSDVDINGQLIFTIPPTPTVMHIDIGLIPIDIIRVEPFVLLEGPLALPLPLPPNPALMGNDLALQGILPTQEPMSALGHTFPNHAVTQINWDLFPILPTDWMVVELRKQGDSTTVEQALPAVVLPDGSVRDPNNQVLTFYGVQPANYYVTIRPRNHIGLMTELPFFLDPTAMTIDFRDPAFLPFGPDNRLMLSNGSMVIRGGDGNSDGVVNAADRSGTWNFRNAVGYLPWDINLDGVVNAADRSGTWNNRNIQEEIPK